MLQREPNGSVILKGHTICSRTWMHQYHIIPSSLVQLAVQKPHNFGLQSPHWMSLPPPRLSPTPQHPTSRSWLDIYTSKSSSVGKLLAALDLHFRPLYTSPTSAVKIPIGPDSVMAPLHLHKSLTCHLHIIISASRLLALRLLDDIVDAKAV